VKNNITAASHAGCNNNWDTPFVGTRTQWDITKSFYIGVDVLYSKIDTATPQANGVFVGANTTNGSQALAIAGSSCIARAVGGCTAADVDNWAFRVRAHKDFLP
jgi:hypothetical protein